mmetsp:Transcript_40967/g.127866  ORF Transcript_40967/g.127866 Transcript_40967/m.127866 type:complete len:204 (+) Transcript_40967:299-910(+)
MVPARRNRVFGTLDAPSEQNPHEHCEGVEVRVVVIRLPIHDLGGNVVRRARGEPPGVAAVGLHGEARQAEVCDLRAVAASEDHVVRFHVADEHASFQVQVLQAQEDLGHPSDGQPGQNVVIPAPGIQDLAIQVAVRAELHDERAGLPMQQHAEEPHQAGVRQGPQVPRHGHLPPRDGAEDHLLHRVELLGLGVPRAPHAAEGA